MRRASGPRAAGPATGNATAGASAPEYPSKHAAATAAASIARLAAITRFLFVFVVPKVATDAYTSSNGWPGL